MTFTAEDDCSKHFRRRFKLPRRIFLFSGIFSSIFAMETAVAMWSDWKALVSSTVKHPPILISSWVLLLGSSLKTSVTTWICRSISCLFYSVHLAQVSPLSCLRPAVGLQYKRKKVLLGSFWIWRSKSALASKTRSSLFDSDSLLFLLFIDLDLY